MTKIVLIEVWDGVATVSFAPKGVEVIIVDHDTTDEQEERENEEALANALAKMDVGGEK